MGYHNEEELVIETESQEKDNDPVAFAECTSKAGWGENQIDKFSVMAISEAFEIKNTASFSEDYLKGHIIKRRMKTEELFATADFGSPMSFLNKKTARRLQEKEKSTLFK